MSVLTSEQYQIHGEYSGMIMETAFDFDTVREMRVVQAAPSSTPTGDAIFAVPALPASRMRRARDAVGTHMTSAPASSVTRTGPHSSEVQSSIMVDPSILELSTVVRARMRPQTEMTKLKITLQGSNSDFKRLSSTCRLDKEGEYSLRKSCRRLQTVLGIIGSCSTISFEDGLEVGSFPLTMMQDCLHRLDHSLAEDAKVHSGCTEVDGCSKAYERIREGMTKAQKELEGLRSGVE